VSYEEQRVHVKVYGATPSSSPRLVRVPGVLGQARRLHTLAAQAFTGMAAAVERDLGLALAIASGWRAHRWESREQYEAVLVKRFGSVREGRKWLAYNSPHETGLAMDIGVGGLWPSRSTAPAQKQQPLHRWLVEHAHEHGWHPYKVEPWHWEYPLSLEAYASGVVGPNDPGPPTPSFEPGDESAEEWALEDEDLVEAAELSPEELTAFREAAAAHEAAMAPG